MSVEEIARDVAPQSVSSPFEAESSTAGLAAAGWTEEVRLAMAWNGGVSLAVWMGGVAVELDAARRARPRQSQAQATAPPDQAPKAVHSTAALYEAICLAFDRRLVIDILAGASAGGLNGCLLAGSIVYDSPLETEFLRDKWIQIGDFSKLLQPLEAKEPGSVMQGELFYENVLQAFAELLGDQPPDTAGEVPVLLDVQVTDVAGEERCFYDSWDQPFYAREYRSPLRFREWRDYKAGTLAAAARASASFPGAFEPQKLYGDAARIAGFEGATRYAIDGGLLENAPIKPAIELLPRRRTNGPVTRYVCYVNAAPTQHRLANDDPSQPPLEKVLGYTFNLPREARVVDQLLALDDASRRAGTTADIGVRLLRLESAALQATAQALLPAYQQRRALQSLEELVGGVNDGSGPRKAKRILRLLGEDVGVKDGGATRLPWIPVDLQLRSGPAGWRFGVRAAQRVLQLEIDLLTAALAKLTDARSASSILTARMAIESSLVFLDGVYQDFVSPLNQGASEVTLLDSGSSETRETALADLETMAGGINQQVWERLQSSTEKFVQAYGALSDDLLQAESLPTSAQLFSVLTSGDLKAEPWRNFVSRALAVEVICRSFADDFDIESGQPLNVAQLTPMLSASLFSLDATHASDRDPVPGAPAEGTDKLAGLRLGHFAGFYRSSWRENDFMWGRIDGATAITRLVVDPARAKNLHLLYRGSELEPAKQLARALTPNPDNPQPGDSDRVKLLRELVPAQSSSDPTANLEAELREAIENDLLASPTPGELTRALCARALQYQALREEVPHLLEQLDHDRVEGAHRTDLGWSVEGDSFGSVILDIRRSSGKSSIPVRLGCDDVDEATSNLGLRTLSQAFLVSLSALAGVLPLTKSLQPVRVPLLAVRGSSAQRPLDRLAVVLGFSGAAWYLTARFLAIPAQTDGNFPLKLLWSAPFLATVVSALAVVGVVAVPAIRGLRTEHIPRKLWECAFAVALAGAAGLAAAIWILFSNSVEEALTAYHSGYAPHQWLLWLVVAAGGFQVASVLNTVLAWAGPLFAAASRYVSRASLILGGVGALFAGYVAVDALAPALNNWGMKTALAIAAFASPLALAWYLDLPRLSWRSVVAMFAPAVRFWRRFRAVHARVNRVAGAVGRPFAWAARAFSPKRAWRGMKRFGRRLRGEGPESGDAISW